MEALHSASSSLNGGKVDVFNGGGVERKCIVVDALISVRSSLVINLPVVVPFMVCSPLLHHSTI